MISGSVFPGFAATAPNGQLNLGVAEAIRSQVQANRERGEDRIAHGRGDEIRGAQRFDDNNAPGGQVELSAYYNNAWRLNDGSYILTDSPNFEPWRDIGLEGQRLQPSQ